MIKTIKVKKKLRLDELIKYVWDNHLYPETFKSNFNDFAHFDKAGKYQLVEQKALNQAVKFTVEVEKDITEDTPFEDIVILHNDGISHLERGTLYYSIRSTRHDYPTVKEIHTLINGKLQLIWESGSDE